MELDWYVSFHESDGSNLIKLHSTTVCFFSHSGDGDEAKQTAESSEGGREE